jgi:hypothetical protein
MSSGFDVPSAIEGSKISAKNGLPPLPVKFTRYDGRTMLWPKRYEPVWNSTGMNACAGSGR